MTCKTPEVRRVRWESVILKTYHRGSLSGWGLYESRVGIRRKKWRERLDVRGPLSTTPGRDPLSLEGHTDDGPIPFSLTLYLRDSTFGPSLNEGLYSFKVVRSDPPSQVGLPSSPVSRSHSTKRDFMVEVILRGVRGPVFREGRNGPDSRTHPKRLPSVVTTRPVSGQSFCT